MGHEDAFPPPDLNGGCRFSHETFAGTHLSGHDAAIPVARKGGLPLANSRPIADLRRGEHIVSDVSEANIGERRSVRAVIAVCCAWELTIGILREAGFRCRESRGHAIERMLDSR